MSGRTLRTVRRYSERMEENSSNLLSSRLLPEATFLPRQITFEDPPRGYVPMDLQDSPIFVPPPSTVDSLPNPSDYSLSSSFASVEVEEISVSGCHVCITISYAIGFIQYPSSTFCYIAPECRRPTIPPVAPPYSCVNSRQISWEDLDGDPLLGIPVSCPPRRPPSDTILGNPGEILTFESWYEEEGYSKARTVINGSNISETENITVPQTRYLRSQITVEAPVIIRYTQSDSSEPRNWGFTIQNDTNPNDVSLGRYNDYDVGYYLQDFLWTWSWIRATSLLEYNHEWAAVGLNTFRQADTWLATKYTATISTIVKRGDEVIWPPPDEPPLTPRRRMPRCCENPSIERLLRLILQRLGNPRMITVPVYDKTQTQGVSNLADAIERWSYHQSNSTADLYKVIEPRAFDGADYPMRLTHAGAKGQKPIRNYLQAWEVILRQIDTAVGLLPFKLKIEDTNAAQKGNQSLEIQVHSISDALKLLVENVVDIEGDGDVMTNLLVRMAAMLIQQHQALAKIEATTRNTEEFLDYKVKQKVQKIPTTLNPLLPQEGQGFGRAESLNQNTEQATENLMPHLLKNTELKVKVTEIDEKRLLSEWLYSIEKFAAATAAGNTVHYKGKETLKQLLDGLIENDEMREFLDRQNIRKAGKESDLTKFSNDAEKGYPSAQGLTESDPNKPYGRPEKKRPKFKRTNRSQR